MASDFTMVCGFGTGLTISMPFLHGLADWRTSACLRAVDGERLFLYDPGVNRFLVSLVNFRKQRSAGHRHDGVAGSVHPSCSAISNPMLLEPSA